MKQLVAFFALIVLIFLVGSCMEDPPQAPTTMAMHAMKLGKGGPPGGGGGGHTEKPTNNNSFPAIAVNFNVAAVNAETFDVPFDLSMTQGLTMEEQAFLEAHAPWYAQKVEGNKWGADFAIQPSVDVTGIDWGDNIESNNPKVRRPFRLEVVLFAPAAENGLMNGHGHFMHVLQFPSSNKEAQGTTQATEGFTVDYGTYTVDVSPGGIYYPGFATVASNDAKLVIQKYPDGQTPTTLTPTWNVDRYSNLLDPVSGFGFAVELNVAGRYIYGASEGGWTPMETGWYRVTFYMTPGSGVNLGTAIVGNYPFLPAPATLSAESEGATATPVVDAANNLSYVDVEVVASGGGGRTE
jgi:hypothetical protein